MRDNIMDIKQLLQKAQELKALFILGQRVVPFLEEIFRFVEEISPLLDTINTSIADNLQKMPKASMQLSKVSEATELATTEILDTLDGMVSKSNTISTNLRTISACAPNDGTADCSRIHELAGQSESLLNSIRDDTTAIIMALQIQDITSQQLAAVNHLLETVQKRFSEIIEQFRREPELDPLLGHTTREPHINVSTLHRKIAFDSNAIDSLNRETGERQGHVDAIIAEKRTGNEEPTPASQDDIDALFGATSAPAADAGPASQDDINALFGAAKPAPAADAGPASQDDIDALFGATSAPVADAGPASQDDIDALFGAAKPAPAADAGPASQDDIDALFNKPT